MEQEAGSGRSSDSEEDGILPDSDSDGRCSFWSSADSSLEEDGRSSDSEEEWGSWDFSLEEDGRSSGSGADVEPVRPEHRHREGLI